MEVEIVLGLQLAIAEAEEALCTCAESFFELDWYYQCTGVLSNITRCSLLALAEFSREFRLTRPVLVQEPILDIKGGR